MLCVVVGLSVLSSILTVEFHHYSLSFSERWECSDTVASVVSVCSSTSPWSQLYIFVKSSHYGVRTLSTVDIVVVI